MKIIYSSPDLVLVNELKSLLEDVGIPCLVKNGDESLVYSGVLINETTPELWIEDDSRLAEAQQIKRDWQAPQPVDASVWTCPKCGEKLEAQFTSCWNCGTAKP